MTRRLIVVLAVMFLTVPSIAQVVITKPTANLAWDYTDKANVDGYNVYASTNLVFGSTPYKVVTGGNNTTTTVDRPGFGVWNFVVRAFKGSIISGSSNTATADFQMVIPTGLTITEPVADAGKFDATIKWASNKPANSIVIYGEAPMLNRMAGLDAATLAHVVVVSGLKNHRVYLYYVISTATNGDKAQSQLYQFVTS